VADGLKAGVDVEFCEDVFDVIVYGRGADVELIRDRSGDTAATEYNWLSVSPRGFGLLTMFQVLPLKC
jgi:hypothetical protein